MDKYFRDRSLSANLPSEVWIKAAKAAGKVTRALVALVPAHNEVLFGTIPTRLMEGPITWVRNNPQSSSVKWKINIAVPELAFSGLARLETAMYSFTLPSPAYQRYLRILDMRDDTSQFYDDDVHLLALSNDAVPAPLTIQFGNRAIVLNGHQQMMPRRSARADAPRHTIIDKPGMDDEMILGRGFLRHFVVVLDYDENMVGLALLRSPSSSEELDDICARRVVRARRVLGASYAPYASRNAGIKCIRSSNYSFDEKASVLDEQGGSGAQSQPSQEYKSVDGLYVRV
ncbi:uncharacterized protein L969DRAFT_94900 [Mixia osmundae IAM 14324]|uniref:Peptidase A1 domain-containing protein n=1 Tax=Mixia osmundae (strain CBS 9802 / IAM 14324 / JCM 22182 / KY 12970) TaxID=764103 RepID=G7E1Z8_MIXOS|nr:uncharacterized protein L969DRAFT_94900 [Mixia osmundae IAM 14324]KEI38706.1 hypothetical protein L969DRAFT_94900 [Mixia osmundae IAM 14324]GAA96835.1 hypothetical protein E5Q_03508 [Mixia osmundae IAM 14324]